MKFLCLILVTRMMPDHVNILFKQKKKTVVPVYVCYDPSSDRTCEPEQKKPPLSEVPHRKDVTLSSRLLEIENVNLLCALIVF